MKLWGITPTTVNGALAMVIRRPSTSGARLNHDSQKPSLITTPNPDGVPPLRSSCGVK